MPPISPEMSAVAIRHPRRAASFVTRVQYKTRNSYNPDEECLSKHAILRRPNYGRWGRKFCVQLTLYTLPSYDRGIVFAFISLLFLGPERGARTAERNPDRDAYRTPQCSDEFERMQSGASHDRHASSPGSSHTCQLSTRSVGPPAARRFDAPCAVGSVRRGLTTMSLLPSPTARQPP